MSLKDQEQLTGEISNEIAFLKLVFENEMTPTEAAKGSKNILLAVRKTIFLDFKNELGSASNPIIKQKSTIPN